MKVILMKAVKFPPISPQTDLSTQSTRQIASSSAVGSSANESVKTGMDAQHSGSAADVTGGASGGGATAPTDSVARTGSRVGTDLGSTANQTMDASGHTAVKSAEATTGHANFAVGAAGDAAARATAQATGVRMA
jgi:hypothetical protein